MRMLSWISFISFLFNQQHISISISYAQFVRKYQNISNCIPTSNRKSPVIEYFTENESEMWWDSSENWNEISNCRIFLLIHQSYPDDEDENLCIEKELTEAAVDSPFADDVRRSWWNRENSRKYFNPKKKNR